MKHTGFFDELSKRSLEFYRKEEELKEQFLQLPRQFYECEFYRRYLTPTDRELYSFLKDRMFLSQKTTADGDPTFVDENGYIFLVFSREEVMDRLGISKPTVVASFKKLSLVGLIYERRMGNRRANRIYVCKVRYMTKEEAIKEIEETEAILHASDKKKKLKSRKLTSENEKLKSEKLTSETEALRSKKLTSETEGLKSKKLTSESTLRLKKLTSIEVKNFYPINTEYSNTEISSSSTLAGDSQFLSDKITPGISPPAANLHPTISAGAEEVQDQDDNEIVKLYEDNIGQLNPVSLDKLMTYCKEHGKDFMIAVIDYAASNNARSITYIDNVIENLARAGANTPEKIAVHLAKYRNERKQAREAWRQNRHIKQKQHLKVYGMVGDKQGDGKPKPGKYEDFYLS
ncbi:DnaD domain protein [Desulfitobacterium chlororespirans]|uniref:DnaD and phage-associated domain-containing protein n=1 Tax=Desulfitobacterium chlororespirans DSM 11544 TaxID=1121395 RepID=A0A1M7T649_9FIRM|nr:DnaD domain protein [Desulfitobacterium chlororespirans]SHN66220.1 DnaD and phage-associated domain-containing protein [Desulfitobacterium chlororespirans DSM 11544]